MNPNDIFWLARYAHNQTAPLFAQAKAIEPTISSSIEIRFADKASRYGKENSILVSAWWNRDGMFQFTGAFHNKADVDRFVAKLEKDVATLQPLEAGIAA